MGVIKSIDAIHAKSFAMFGVRASTSVCLSRHHTDDRPPQWYTSKIHEQFIAKRPKKMNETPTSQILLDQMPRI